MKRTGLIRQLTEAGCVLHHHRRLFLALARAGCLLVPETGYQDTISGTLEIRSKLGSNVKGMKIMESLKHEAIAAITKLPDSADIDEIMYRLYVIDKIRKGEDAIKSGEYATIEDLKKEIESW